MADQKVMVDVSNDGNLEQVEFDPRILIPPPKVESLDTDMAIEITSFDIVEGKADDSEATPSYSKQVSDFIELVEELDYRSLTCQTLMLKKGFPQKLISNIREQGNYWNKVISSLKSGKIPPFISKGHLPLESEVKKCFCIWDEDQFVPYICSCLEKIKPLGLTHAIQMLRRRELINLLGWAQRDWDEIETLLKFLPDLDASEESKNTTLEKAATFLVNDTCDYISELNQGMEFNNIYDKIRVKLNQFKCELRVPFPTNVTALQKFYGPNGIYEHESIIFDEIQSRGILKAKWDKMFTNSHDGQMSAKLFAFFNRNKK